MSAPAEQSLKRQAAWQAITTFWAFRADLSDSDEVAEMVEEIKKAALLAQAEKRRLNTDEMIKLALGINEVCKAEGLPNLYAF